MKNESCELIQDLMPLCVDGTASEATRACVEDHLATCESCKTVYAEMQSAVEMKAPKENPEFAKAMKTMQSRRKRRIWRTMFRGVALTLVTVAVLLCAYVWYFATPQLTPGGKISFHQTAATEGIALMYVRDIPEGAEMRVSILPTDRDGDGEYRYEAYVSMWATRAQQRHIGAGAYYILGSVRDDQIYMSPNGQTPVQISQVVYGTVADGGKVIYLDSSDLPQVAMFGLMVRTPESISWYATYGSNTYRNMPVQTPTPAESSSDLR